MTTFTKPILAVMAATDAHMTSQEIRDAVDPDADIAAITGALNDMQDTGHALMRNGFYRLSEKAKQEQAA